MIERKFHSLQYLKQNYSVLGVTKLWISRRNQPLTMIDRKLVLAYWDKTIKFPKNVEGHPRNSTEVFLLKYLIQGFIANEAVNKRSRDYQLMLSWLQYYPRGYLDLGKSEKN